jgi:LAS superfamily LD-carboxypeptidase LdcB
VSVKAQGCPRQRPAAAHGSIVISTRRRALLARVTLAAAVVSIVAPAPSDAQEEDPAGGRDPARQDGSAQVELDVDVLRGDGADVESALGDVSENVVAQQAALDAAQAAVAQAEVGLNDANAAVAAAQGQLDGLAALTDEVVIDAYVNPPAEAGIDVLSAESLSDASIKQTILDHEATSDAALLDRFEDAQAQLEVEKAARQEAASAAADRRSDAEAALADLRSAVSQQVRFVLDVERRLDQRLYEAENLADLDPGLAGQILAREAEVAGVVSQIQAQARAEAAQALADQLAEQAAEEAAERAAAQQASSVQGASGGLATVSCPSGGSITVANDIADALSRMLDAAAADGVEMCGGGYRDPQEQIETRRANCGPTDYDIYEAPSSSCSPPTARPGTSMHEQGLAVDFTCGDGGTVDSGDACSVWLQSNAADYGFHNLPSEAWHYSVNGE